MEMDLYNNKAGRLLTFDLLKRNDVTEYNFVGLIKDKILTSLNDGNSERIDTNGQIIPTDSSERKKYDWYHFIVSNGFGRDNEIYLSSIGGDVLKMLHLVRFI